MTGRTGAAAVSGECWHSPWVKERTPQLRGQTLSHMHHTALLSLQRLQHTHTLGAAFTISSALDRRTHLQRPFTISPALAAAPTEFDMAACATFLTVSAVPCLPLRAPISKYTLSWLILSNQQAVKHSARSTLQMVALQPTAFPVWNMLQACVVSLGLS